MNLKKSKLSTFYLVFIFLLTLMITSSCKNKSLLLSIRNPLAIPPISPSTIAYNSISTHPQLTPWLKWTEGQDNSTLGLDTYEIAIGTSKCASDTATWTNLKTEYQLSLSHTEYALDIPTPLVDGASYYISIRSKDLFGQLGPPTCGESFTYTTAEWKQTAYIKAENSNTQDFFGDSISLDGDTLVVGAPFESSNQTTITNGPTASTDNSAANSGAVYVYRKVLGEWIQEAYIKAPNAEAGDQFGLAVTISGDTLAVSSTQESSNQNTITNGTTASPDNSASQAGAVYIFKRTGTNWAQEAYLKASNANTGDFFGNSISLDADTLVVGAVGEDSILNTITNGTGSSIDNSFGNSGAVYVYKRTGVNWDQEAYIKASNSRSLGEFGNDVQIDGDTLVVGAKLDSSNQNTITNGSTSSSNLAATESGAVFVYKRTGVNWDQEAYIKPSNSQAMNQFGYSVSIDNDTIAVGAIKESSSQNTITNGSPAAINNTLSESGAVYIYQRTGLNWAEQAYIKPSNGQASNKFGTDVSISGNLLSASSPFDDNLGFTLEIGSTPASMNTRAQNSGAVFLYERSGVSWTQKAYIKAFNSTLGNEFGDSICLNGNQLAVSAPNERSNSNAIINGPTASFDISSDYSGATYIYEY